MTAMTDLRQAARWLRDGVAVGDVSTAFRRVHTDTRTLQAGDLFVALKGERFDANQMLAQAKACGAVAALCHPGAGLSRVGLPGIEVPDTLIALGELATGWRAQFSLALIAVTGSNGKTTVTQMLAAILRACHPATMLATQGNFNNAIGVPLTLLRLHSRHRIAAVELGMNHPGEIARLAAMARPTVALVNNAQREHLEFMSSVDAVAHENGSVIHALADDGVAVFPRDDAFADLWTSMAAQRRTLRFAVGDGAADIRCNAPQWHSGAWHIQAATPLGALAFQLRIAGLHNVHNALAAASCAIAAGVGLEPIARGLEEFEPVQGRSRAITLHAGDHTCTLVDDSYNANPDSVAAALALLAGLPTPRLMVLGDMGEVGEQGKTFHAQAGELAQQLGIESLFTLGELASAASQCFSGARHFDHIDALNAAVLNELPRHASVLVKGSRFMQMERVVQAITRHAQPLAADKQEVSCC